MKNPQDKALDIVFFGTPDFAVGILDRLMASSHRIKAVVTSPDKPAGRGRKLKASAVKKYAQEKGIPVLQPENLKDPAFLDRLKNIGADVFVVVAFRILPRQVWQMPPLGTFNLHASLLPDYRGAAPINWVIINGERQTGVTTFFIDDKIDTGEIILQKTVDIAPGETAGTLHDKLMHAGAGLTLETLDLLAGGPVKTQPQRHLETRHPAPKLTPANTRIDWHRPAAEIERLIRGLSPYPGAWTQTAFKGTEQKWRIYAAKATVEPHSELPGTAIREGKQLKIATADGWIWPLEVKPQAKRRMSIRDLLNGLQGDSDELVFL